MPQIYEIRVSDRLGPALRGAFNGMRAETVPRHTVIEGWLSVDELRTLLVRMEHTGGQLVHLDCVPPHRGVSRACPS
jgi:hypothetical protein